MSKLIFLADVLRYIWRAVEPLMSWMGVRGCRSLKRIFGIVWKGLDARIGQGCILGLAYIRWSDPPVDPNPATADLTLIQEPPQASIMACHMTCLVGIWLDILREKTYFMRWEHMFLFWPPRPASAGEGIHVLGFVILTIPFQWYYTVQCLTWRATYCSVHQGPFTIKICECKKRGQIWGMPRTLHHPRPKLNNPHPHTLGLRCPDCSMAGWHFSARI